MNSNKYVMSFTTGGLFHTESVKISELFLEMENWDAVREKVLSENLLQARTVNTLKRICLEVMSRLKTLDNSELKCLVQADAQEQGYLLWLAICRRYKFIGEFAVEVIREGYLSLKTDLHKEDFDSFFNRKAEWHTELDEIRPATKERLRQVLFKMLREADLLTAKNGINAAMISPSLLALLTENGKRDYLFFPVFESDLKGLPS